jgi:hypothetical protein
VSRSSDLQLALQRLSDIAQQAQSAARQLATMPSPVSAPDAETARLFVTHVSRSAEHAESVTAAASAAKARYAAIPLDPAGARASTFAAAHVARAGTRAADAAMRAAGAADIAHAGSLATSESRRARAAATDAAAAANAVTDVRSIGSVIHAVNAAQRAIERTIDVFSSLIHTQVQTSREPGNAARRLMDLAVVALPRAHRGRYREEWLSLLTEVPTRRGRARHLMSLLACAPRQTYVLRRPRAARSR